MMPGGGGLPFVGLRLARLPEKDVLRAFTWSCRGRELNAVFNKPVVILVGRFPIGGMCGGGLHIMPFAAYSAADLRVHENRGRLRKPCHRIVDPRSCRCGLGW